MPYYEFTDSKNKIVELFFESNSAPKIGEVIIHDNKKLTRIPSFLNATIDAIDKIDPFDSKSFVEKTGKKVGNMGNLYDESERLSLLREEKTGRDVIKEKHEQEKAKKMENRRAANKRKKVKKNG